MSALTAADAGPPALRTRETDLVNRLVGPARRLLLGNTVRLLPRISLLVI